MLLACSVCSSLFTLVGVVIGTSMFQSLALGSLIPVRMDALLCWIVMSSLVNVASNPLSQNSPMDNKFLLTFLK